VHDFAYADLAFDGYRPPSILQCDGAREVAVELYSLTKGFSLAGWRVAFVLGRADVVGALARLKSYLDYGSFQPLQIAATVALREARDQPAQAAEVYEGRRNALCDGLTRAGWQVARPKATMFVWARIPTDENAQDFALRLLREGHVDFTGEYYSAENSVLRPRGPSPKGPRILIGAKGPRMLKLVAQYADAWNTAWHLDPAIAAQRWENLKAACAEVGRDPSTIEFTVGVPIRVLLNGETAPEGGEPAIAGSPEQVAEALHGFEAIGAQHVILAPEPNGPGSIERIGLVLEAYKG